MMARPTINVNTLYKLYTKEEAMREKEWAAGPIQRQTISGIYFDDSFTAFHKVAQLSPCLDKCTDELVVNALDQLVQFPQLVTKLEVNFDEHGTISVYNNGTGVPGHIHDAATAQFGRPIYAPEMIFGMMFQGSNTKKSADSIVGGTNGLGSKIANCHAVTFIVRTVYNGILYLQTWTANMSKCEPPRITATKEEDSVKITFAPDYLGDFKYTKEELAAEMTMLRAVVRTRAVFASVYARCMSPKCSVKFNGKEIAIKTTEDLAQAMYPGRKVLKTKIEVAPYTWQVAAIINARQQPAVPVAITNGVITSGGTHMKHFATKLTKALSDKFTERIDSSDVRITPAILGNCTTLVMCTMVPGAQWNGQRKDILAVDAGRFKGKKFTDEFVNRVYDEVKASILCASITKKQATGKQKETIQLACYTPADYCNDKRRAQSCGLLAGEGNSAANHLRMAVCATMGLSQIGIMALRGVPMNARKHITRMDITNGETTEEIIIRNNELIKNKELTGLVSALGLDYSYKYEPGSPTYANEIAEMHYGWLCMCVDQDLDGKGNILGQIVSMFALFWPNLLKAGYVRWLVTPIIRMYPKAGGQVLSFQSVAAHKQAIANQTIDPEKYETRYYKGLGTHTAEEIIDVMKNFDKNMLVIKRDLDANESLETYFGKISGKRKHVLSKPVTQIPDEDALRILSTRSITCSELTTYEVDPYQRDNLARKLDHVLDGQNQCGRMVLNYLMCKIHKDIKYKVDGLAGFITATQHYTHGEASLHQTLIGKAFLATGGKQLPFLIPIGNFGTRIEGGHDASPPRYLETKANWRLLSAMFPPTDYYSLPFTLQEGKYLYPDYFLPIIPCVILETSCLPSHGWKLQKWARDVFSVIEATRNMIKDAQEGRFKLLYAGSLPPCVYGPAQRFTGGFTMVNGINYSLGRYTLTGNLLQIHELPLGVWTAQYLAKKGGPFVVKDPEIIYRVKDNSSSKIDITVVLMPGALEKMAELNTRGEFDDITEYFKLRKAMHNFINLMSINDRVTTFSSYEAAFHYWFSYRKDLYADRFRREVAVCRVNIYRLANIIRYIDEYQSLHLSGISKGEMCEILACKGFDRCDVAMLHPKWIATADIEQAARANSSKAYNYLLSLSSLGMTNKKRAKFVDDLEAAKKKLAVLLEELEKPTAGCDVWLKELDVLSAVIRKGFDTSWQFDEFGKYKL